MLSIKFFQDSQPSSNIFVLLLIFGNGFNNYIVSFMWINFYFPILVFSIFRTTWFVYVVCSCFVHTHFSMLLFYIHLSKFESNNASVWDESNIETLGSWPATTNSVLFSFNVSPVGRGNTPLNTKSRVWTRDQGSTRHLSLLKPKTKEVQEI